MDRGTVPQLPVADPMVVVVPKAKDAASHSQVYPAPRRKTTMENRMPLNFHRTWASPLVVPLLVGCASWRASFNETVSSEASEQYSSVDRHSSYPVIRRNVFEQVNLLELIDPKHESTASGMRTLGS